MEKRGWIDAEWGTSELGRRVKLYRLTAAGRKQLAGDAEAWAVFAAAVNKVNGMRRRLRSLLWRVPVEQEVHDELTHHRELRTSRTRRPRIDARGARAEVERRLDGVAPALRRLGEGRNRVLGTARVVDELAQDVRFALRQSRCSRASPRPPC